MSDHYFHLLGGYRRRRRGSAVAVEDDGDLLQSVATRLRVGEVGCDQKEQEHDHEDDVVPPVNGLQRDGVDEGVDEDGSDARAPGDGETSGSETELPDLARVGGQEGGPAPCQQGHTIGSGARLGRDSHGNVIAGVEDEQERDDCEADARRCRLGELGAETGDDDEAGQHDDG